MGLINPALENSPKHLRLIGLMVVGYGELELAFCHCAGLTLGLKYETLDALHEVRSESSRLKIAHSLTHARYAELGLKDAYAEMLGGLRHCLSIRNQYAHSQFKKERGRLMFFNPEGAFRDPSKPFAWKATSLPLLREQAELFEWTRDMLIWLEMSIPMLADGLKLPIQRPAPQKRPLPRLHIEQGSRARLKTKKVPPRRP